MTTPMKTLRLAAITMLVSSIAAMPADPASAQATTRPPNLAWYEDRWIDLSVSWEGAGACDIATAGSVCFDSETEMDRYLESAAETMAAAHSQLTITSTCSSALRLYDGTSYAGTVISLNIELANINLSNYSFDNRTSSYKIGACSSTFFSSADGGGLVYTGDTRAFAQAASMNFGWDNVVSSVYIS